MKRSVWASAGKKSRANVVLPAPLGPAMMMIFFKFSSFKRFYALQGQLPTARSGPQLLEIPVLLVTKKDLLDLASISPSDPFIGHLAHVLMS
jgi:hypothetical protein